MLSSGRKVIGLRGVGRVLMMVIVFTVLAVVEVGGSFAWGDVPAPAWSVEAVAQPTSFSPADNEATRCGPNLPFSGCDRYNVVVTNIGTRPSNGTVTVTDVLPEGMTASRLPRG